MKKMKKIEKKEKMKKEKILKEDGEGERKLSRDGIYLVIKVRIAKEVMAGDLGALRHTFFLHKQNFSPRQSALNAAKQISRQNSVNRIKEKC